MGQKLIAPADYIIEIFGGVRATARALGLAASTVSLWSGRSKGLIPRKNWTKILKVATAKGLEVSFEDLVLHRDTKGKRIFE